jgi:hypothetical protein
LLQPRLISSLLALPGVSSLATPLITKATAALISPQTAWSWFNKFSFALSEGASGGIFVGWNSTIFEGQVMNYSKFAITIWFTTTHNAEEWLLTDVYGPCHWQECQDFINWLNSLNIDDGIN